MGNPAALIESRIAEAVTNGPRSDRRRHPTSLFSRYAWLGGRRHAPRRAAELEGSVVDVHGSGLFLTVTMIAVLNFLDAFFTILYLSFGGTEMNPIVQVSLDMGLPWFIALKSVGIGICLLFLTLTKNSLLSRIGLAIVFFGYLALLGWHGVLYLALSASGAI